VAYYFFDSSAIVKRYTSEIGTGWVISISDPIAGNFIYLASITGVEVVSAITRQVLASRITRTDAANEIAKFRHDFINQYRVVEISTALINRAMSLAEAHALRGYDAVQLAALLIVNDENIAFGLSTLTLISADAALNSAATAEGLTVEDPNNHS
jgi:predicted nucleic acid-binding protein